MIDPMTGERMPVDDAIKKGLVDARYRDALERAECAVVGYTDKVTGDKLSLYEAMKKKYVVESHGIRLVIFNVICRLHKILTSYAIIIVT